MFEMCEKNILPVSEFGFMTRPHPSRGLGGGMMEVTLFGLIKY